MYMVSAQRTMKVRKQGILPDLSKIQFRSQVYFVIAVRYTLSPKYSVRRTKLPTSTLFLVFFTAESQVWVAHDQRSGTPGFPDSRDFLTIHNAMNTV